MIEVKNYTKILKKRTILDDISYEFQDGKIYGLHGRNGSGKTMLLRALCGLIFPTSGSVKIDGKELHKDIEFPDSVGIIIEDMSMFPEYSGYDNLRMLAKIKKIASDEDIQNVLRKVGLDIDGRLKVKEYSLGMRQKLNIAQAIMESPKLLLLDEPTNALDDETILKIRDILLELNKENNTTIIIASHNQEDLHTLCDEILEIKDGKIYEDASK